MQLFVKMKPYIILERILQKNEENSQIMRRFITETAEGKQNVFWKLGLILNHDIKLTLMDKDMKFDDYIGEVIVNKEILNI